MQQKNIIKKKLENKVKKREETLWFLLFFATLVLLSIRKHVPGPGDQWADGSPARPAGQRTDRADAIVLKSTGPPFLCFFLLPFLRSLEWVIEKEFSSIEWHPERLAARLLKRIEWKRLILDQFQHPLDIFGCHRKLGFLDQNVFPRHDVRRKNPDITVV